MFSQPNHFKINFCIWVKLLTAENITFLSLSLSLQWFHSFVSASSKSAGANWVLNIRAHYLDLITREQPQVNATKCLLKLMACSVSAAVLSSPVFCWVILFSDGSLEPLTSLLVDCSVPAELYNICLARAKEKWNSTAAPSTDTETIGRDGLWSSVFTFFSFHFCCDMMSFCQTFQVLQTESRVWSWSSWTSPGPSPNCASSSRSDSQMWSSQKRITD